MTPVAMVPLIDISVEKEPKKACMMGGELLSRDP